jgi:hypothetical protein
MTYLFYTLGNYILINKINPKGNPWQNYYELVYGRIDGEIYIIKFDGSNLSSGVYFYSLSAAEVNFAKTMILLK